MPYIKVNGEWLAVLPAAHDHALDHADVGAAADDDLRLSDAREPLEHGNDAHTDTYVASTDVTNIVQITQSAYDALDPADPDTLYVVID